MRFGRMRIRSAHDLTEQRQCRVGQFVFLKDRVERHVFAVVSNSILKKYKLTDPALALLGEVVRAADSHPSKPHPAGEGLRWVAFGFSALGLSDPEILKQEFVVYDALYAECRRRTASESKP